MRGKRLRNRMNGGTNHKENRQRNGFAECLPECLPGRLAAAVMALALIFGTVPVPAIYAEQAGGEPYVHDSADTAEGESVSEDSEEEKIGADSDKGEKSVTTPNAEGQQILEAAEDTAEQKAASLNVEKQPGEPGETVRETRRVSEPETVSVNAVTAAYGLRAPEDKSGGLSYQYQSELPAMETEYTAGNGTILWTPKLEGGKVVSGTLTLKNAVIDADGVGIQVCVPTTVVLEGENRISAGKTNSNASGMVLGLALEGGLDYSDGSVITGSGSLEIQSKGGGVQSPKGITIDRAKISIVYAGSGGIWTSDADITIRNNSQVKVTGSAASGGVWTQSASADITIENSKVIVINDAGGAMRAAGSIRLISSDVRTVGNTSSSGASGTLSYGYLTVDGGLLYAGNTGTDEGIPYTPGITEMINGSVLYTAKYQYVLQIQGGTVWYSQSSYNQATDTITVGGVAEVIGNVIWNENMYVPKGKALQVGRNFDAKLTIPEGTIMEIPETSSLKIYSANGNQGTLTNDGTINIQDGGSLSTIYSAGSGGGIIENNGTIQVSDRGILQNQNVLDNTGTIHSTGNFSNVCLTGYPGSINNSGIIDGFVIEMRDDVNVNKANGNTVIKKGQTLTLGVVGSNKGRILQVPEGATLTVEEGAVVDAKTHVTQDTLSQYLKIDDTLVLNGTLLLPDNTPEAVIQELGQHIEGDGSIQVGDITGGFNYYIAQVAGSASGNTGKGLYQEGATVDIDAGDKAGYRFLGWTAVPENVTVTDARAVRTTFTMPKGSVKLTANWEQITYGVTVNGSKAAVTGAGVYAAGEVVSVDAGSREGYVFKGWSSGDGVVFADPSQAATTFVMPGHPVTVTASWGEKPEETTSSPEETTPSPEETTSSGGTGSSSGNQSSSSGTDGKQKNPQPAANPEETLPIAETNETQNQNVSAAAASADTGDASHMGWYLLSGILSLSGCMAMIRRLTKNTLD